ncbi:hypothetical protein EYE40_03760 [Glaciihabitans arcticus]|uniref:Uncharacterized protein n=1 Tax=Glaciihabitans arcticus TaxID=2668039 RepID=A0A4Q9GRA4_9MICO|nr:Imm61 family immunity protein [Glaciihabitans arcticus]TBN56584.1 hypothetical protein EYE40_03760 [Glaciihabitans arcticus]
MTASQLTREDLELISAPSTYTVTPVDDGFDLSDARGDIRYKVRPGWRVSRSERSGPFIDVFSASGGAAVQRYLLLRFAADVRLGHDLPWLHPEQREIAPGFTIESTDEGQLLHGPDGVAECFRPGNPGLYEATTFSWLARADVADLLRSLLDAAGEPLLAAWVQRPIPRIAVKRLAWNGTAEVPAVIVYTQPDYTTHRVTVTIGRDSWTSDGPDAFAALDGVREQLEPLGISLLVEGARVGSYPSGMQRDQGSGLVVYRMEPGAKPTQRDVRDTFGAVGRDEVGSIAEQVRFFRDWLA